MKAINPDPDSLSIGYFFPAGQTNHVWSDEAARRTPRMNRHNLLALAQAAEDAGFDSLFIADNWSGHQRAAERGGHQAPAFHAPLLAMGIFAVTDHIGVITTLHTTHHRPAHVARMGATLDAFSDGRWGWNAVTGHAEPEAALFGEPFIEHDERYAMAAEFVDIVQQLWRKDDPIEVVGKYYRAQGRIKAPRPVQQPRPLIVSAGASTAGATFAADWCDALVTLARTEDDVRSLDDRLQNLLGNNGRTVTSWPFAICIVRDGDGEAQEEYEHLLRSLNADAAWEIAGDILGSIETAQAMFDRLGRDEAVRAIGSGSAMLRLIGTPDQVAGQLISLKRNTGAGGVLINFPLWSPRELRNFGAVLRRLEEAGVRTPPAARNYSW
ncbi:LLM class flavin-dependent oxidoreductase [Amycolatopsis pithecellobii]|uniref:LLM class flavin-dependent oxidoreductase n=1 Tax=Amycolatopsis pithecellobii TaxID=664692 RepID=A0A6N7Z415_9PSEU|nr:LLM class flavin-dependent oxidoreductase [Amycolatopsis pithecellobii]MTD54950.1 LLM class flavin-dependent oxidoreductase [Amycolatopsis pithecellobii]